MKLRFIIRAGFCFLFLGNVGNAFANSVDSLFANVPRHILPLLDKTSKLDLLDLYNSGMEARAENTYGGETRLIAKTDKWLLLQSTAVSTWQIKVLETEKENCRILCLRTIKSKGYNSDLTVYDKHWNVVKCDIPKPSWDKFFVPNSEISPTRLQALCSTLRELPVQITLSYSSDAVVCSLSMDDLPKEIRKDAEKCVRTLSFHWVKGRFEKIESQ